MEDRKDKVIWAAGFVDGEGCIQIRSEKTPSGEGRNFRLHLVVTNTVIESLGLLQEVFGGSISKANNGTLGKKQLYKWQISTRNAEAALREMAPFMCVKKAQAYLALEFQGKRGGRGEPRTDERKVWDDWAFEEMKLLKQVV